MLVSDAVRAVALGSIAVALAIDDLSFAHIIVVALIEGCGAGRRSRRSALAASASCGTR
jgi:hypothetical protein